MRLGIIGSCVSRDLFARIKHLSKHFELGPYISRASMISMVAKPMPSKYINALEMSGASFEDRRFIQDLGKRYWQLLSESKCDVVLIDLIDERHATFCLDDVALTYTKASRCYLDVLLERGCGVLLQPMTDVWEKRTWKSLDTFSDIIRTTLPRTCTPIVHYARYASCRLSPVSRTRAEFPIAQQVASEKWNIFLNRAYEILTAQLQALELRLDTDDVIAGGDHLWDLTPYHYDLAYYAKLGEKLIALACATR